MKLPSRIIDLSSPLENETVYDPPFMRPKIAYRSNAETAPLMCELFAGLRREDLPNGEAWAIEEIALWPAAFQAGATLGANSTRTKANATGRRVDLMNRMCRISRVCRVEWPRGYQPR